MTDERLREICDWADMARRGLLTDCTFKENYRRLQELLAEVRRLRRYEELLDKWHAVGVPEDLRTRLKAAVGSRPDWIDPVWMTFRYLRDCVDCPPEQKLASPAEHKLEAIRKPFAAIQEILDG